jgi:hypothetical protein
VRQHLNSNAACSSRRCNFELGAFLCRIRPDCGQAEYMFCQQRSAHVLRRSPGLPLVYLQAKPKAALLGAIHVCPIVGAKWLLHWASHRKAAGQESSCGLFSLVSRCGKGRVPACLGAVGQVLVAVGCVSRTVGQCKQEAQRCLTLRSSGAPTAWRTGHQAQGLRPILRLLSSTPRCLLPLTSNVRRRKYRCSRQSN